MSETEWRAPKWDGPRWRSDGAAMYSRGDEGVAVMTCAPGLAHELTLELNAREVASLPAVAFEVQRREDLAAEFDRILKSRERSRDRARASLSEAHRELTRLRAIVDAARALHAVTGPWSEEYEALGAALKALDGGDRG